ncbi:hypothetical protein AAC387_Pa10g0412 [Persea americana]
MSEEPRSLFQSDLFTFMPCLGIGILTVSTIFSAIRARHDLPTLSFVISIYVFLMLLFWCLHLHDRSPHDTKRKERLKVPIWLFATILNVLFAYRVSTILPLSLDFLIMATSKQPDVNTSSTEDHSANEDNHTAQDRLEELACLFPKMPSTLPTKLQLFIIGLQSSVRDYVIDQIPNTLGQAFASAVRSKTKIENQRNKKA